MLYFNFNGKIFEEGTPILGADSRAVRYGDGVFETLKIKKGNLILADDHYARLWKGMQQLRFDRPKLLTPEKLTDEIFGLAKKNKHSESRIRIGVYRGDGGLYDAKNNQPNYVIQSWPLAEDNGMLNANGLQLSIYKDAQKNCDSFSNLKHNNYLPYLMGALAAKENKCNDAIILNNHQRVCDSTIANIFIIKDDVISTPALSEGCVAGTMRKFLLQQLAANDFKIKEKEITIDELMDADEIFLSNAIYNIRWVAGIENKTFGNQTITRIDNLLRQTNGLIFC